MISYFLYFCSLMKVFELKNVVLKTISEIISETNLEAYVVGGYVRDMILGRPSKDIDIVVVGSGIDLAHLAHRRVRARGTVTFFKSFGTAMFKHHDIEYEFVGARKESYNRESRKPIVEDGTLEDDQNRRDFTINALAIDLSPKKYGQLVDPFGGIADLENRIIRTPLDPDITFSDDPLRMLRAIRFACQLAFRIHDETLESITRNAERIKIVSMERVNKELEKILMSERPSVGFSLLQKVGILPIILPELSAMRGVEVIDGNAHKDNFYHTLQVVDQIVPKTNNLYLRWAALLHDIAKPRTKKFYKGIGWTFHGHEVVGVYMVADIFRRLKMPTNEKMKYVQKIVNMHLRPIALVEDGVTDSAIRRLLYDAGDDVDDLMTLCEADITSKNDKKVRQHMSNLKMVRAKLKEIEEKDAIRNMKFAISGDQIMEIFGIEPGRVVGIIKNDLKDQILDGKISNTYEQAYDFVIAKGAELGLSPKKNDHEN